MSNFAVRILTGADVDIEQAIEWYEHQKTGLGYVFYQSFRETVHRLADNPFLFQTHFLFVRRATFDRFPYHIFYAIDEYNEVVEVIAVLHQAINPKELRKRINFE